MLDVCIPGQGHIAQLASTISAMYKSLFMFPLFLSSCLRSLLRAISDRLRRFNLEIPLCVEGALSRPSSIRAFWILLLYRMLRLCSLYEIFAREVCDSLGHITVKCVCFLGFGFEMFQLLPRDTGRLEPSLRYVLFCLSTKLSLAVGLVLADWSAFLQRRLSDATNGCFDLRIARLLASSRRPSITVASKQC